MNERRALNKLVGNRPVERMWLVLEGDWGGQIYLTVPWKLVSYRAKIFQLLSQLDKFAWSCNTGDGRSAYLVEGKDSPCGVAGGMGGGLLTDDLWMHEEFCRDPHWKILAHTLLDIR